MLLFGHVGVLVEGKNPGSFFKNMFFFIGLQLLNTQVTNEDPTSGHGDVCSVGTPRGASSEKYGQNDCKTTFLPWVGVSLGRMLHIGRARHPGPGSGRNVPGRLSVEFVNVGGWLTNGDGALDHCAQFLAVAEHRLIPARARSIRHQLRKADRSTFWWPCWCWCDWSAWRFVLPTADGGVVHFFVVYGYQGGGF